MKNVLMFLTIVLFLFLNGCKKDRKYVYPQPKRVELERICEFIKARGTNRFMVLLGKIYPLNNDGYTMPIENLHTKLSDAGYFCGNTNFKDLYCNKIYRKNNLKNNCTY